MKKVNVYTSKAGRGKSFVMMIDAVKMAASGNKVAYITTETSDRFVVKRMNHIAKYFNLKGKISRKNLVIFSVPFGQEKITFDKIEKIKKDFDVLFLDPFEGIRSFEYSATISIFRRTQEAFVKLVNVLDSEDSNLKSINTTVSAYLSLGSNNITFAGYQGFENRVVLKTFCSRDYFGEQTIISASDFENKSVKEYNLTEIMK
jgi:hypothetical protein